MMSSEKTTRLRCRYADCAEAHPVATEQERITCPTCRDDMGLPPLEGGSAGAGEESETMSSEKTTAAGWELEHTGGNCTGLQRPAAGSPGWYWFLTDGDASAPETATEPVTLGLYDSDGFTVGAIPFPDTRAALIAVAAAEGRAGDVLARLLSCIEESDDPSWADEDGHAPIVRELRALIGGAK